MGQVSVTLNNRTYRIGCGDGEEQRLSELGSYLATKVDRLKEEFGQIGDDRLLVMAALIIVDELFEAREPADAGPKREREKRKGRGSAARASEADPDPAPDDPASDSTAAKGAA
ncbi:MAG: cell division protein ZapA [Hyphomicrobiaceae bacterium]